MWTVSCALRRSQVMCRFRLMWLATLAFDFPSQEWQTRQNRLCSNSSNLSAFRLKADFLFCAIADMWLKLRRCLCMSRISSPVSALQRVQVVLFALWIRIFCWIAVAITVRSRFSACWSRFCWACCWCCSSFGTFWSLSFDGILAPSDGCCLAICRRTEYHVPTISVEQVTHLTFPFAALTTRISGFALAKVSRVLGIRCLRGVATVAISTKNVPTTKNALLGIVLSMFQSTYRDETRMKRVPDQCAQCEWRNTESIETIRYTT